MIYDEYYQESSDKQAQAKYQCGTKPCGGDRHMQWLSEFIYQIVTVFLFVISLSFMLYFLSEKDQNKMLWFGFAAWVFMGAALAVYLNTKVLIEPPLSGVLKPSNESNPMLEIPVPQNALLINFGSNFAFSTQSSFVAVRIANDDVLTVSRSREGISLNAHVYSADGRIVAGIENNEFTINPNNYFKKKRPDKSTFIVYNQSGEEALNVRFANPRYMLVTGTFHLPKYGTLTATNDGIRTPGGGIIQGNISGENRGAQFSF